VGVADDQTHPAQAPRAQALGESRPDGAVLAVADREPQHFPVPRGVGVARSVASMFWAT
jgi:hypothetical protein